MGQFSLSPKQPYMCAIIAFIPSSRTAVLPYSSFLGICDTVITMVLSVAEGSLRPLERQTDVLFLLTFGSQPKHSSVSCFPIPTEY